MDKLRAFLNSLSSIEQREFAERCATSVAYCVRQFQKNSFRC